MSAQEKIWIDATETHMLCAQEKSDDVQYIRADLVPQWQDIETAPKDGQWFLTARFIDGCEAEYEVGAYDPSIHRSFNERPDGLFEAKDTQIYDWRGFNSFNRATHWMPLPTPPDPTQ